MTAVLIYSSDPRSDSGDWKARFDRYTAASADSSKAIALFMPSETEECLRWFRTRADCRALVLWDAAGRVPPKEIEAFLAHLEQSALVCSARFGVDSIGRGAAFLQCIGGRLLGCIRRAAGLTSDVLPTCLGIRRDAIGMQFFEDLRTPVAGWAPAICREARYRRIPILEIPVMWASLTGSKSGSSSPR